MTKLIALDAGHGRNTPGKRTPPIPELNGRVVLEYEFNRAVVKYLAEDLKRCGFRTLLVAPYDNDVSLEERVMLANVNKADAYISIHYNAYDGSFEGANPEGFEVFYFKGSNSGRKLATKIHKYLLQGTPQVNRGIKYADYYVLRKTNMVAILSENGFMDNKREAKLMLDVNFQKEVAEEHCKGICDYFGMPFIKPITFVDQVNTSKIEDGTYFIVAKHSGKVLDLTADNRLIQWQLHGGLNQRFSLKKENGYYTVLVNDRALDVENGRLEKNSGIISWPSHGGENQKWKFIEIDDGSFIISTLNGLALDVERGRSENGARIILFDIFGTDNQSWYLIRSYDSKK